ncbi:MAG: sigma-70 family RNA polymerase sigma factor [Lachnospiraceae bacterium]|nr:sigma-70 family RNA polymerase sigma factor [Lachnospiraceae bacterium]
MDNETLVQNIQAGINTEKNLLALWDNNLGFVNLLIHPFTKKYEYDDLMQECFLALYDAVAYYKVNESAFLTYYAIWAKSHIFTYIESCSSIHIPRNMQVYIRRYNKITQTYLTEYHRKPTTIEYKAFLNVSDKVLNNIIKASEKCSVNSIDKEHKFTDGDSYTLLDTIPDSKNQYEEVLNKVNNEQLSNVLSEALADINPVQADSIKYHYYDNMTYNDIASILGLSPEAVRQTISNGIRHIRRGKYSRQLRDYVEEQYNYAYKGGLSQFKTSFTSATEQSAMNLLHMYGIS